jgi:hypothetical protein
MAKSADDCISLMSDQGFPLGGGECPCSFSYIRLLLFRVLLLQSLRLLLMLLMSLLDLLSSGLISIALLELLFVLLSLLKLLPFFFLFSLKPQRTRRYTKENENQRLIR